MPHVLGELKGTCKPLNKRDVRVLVVKGRKIGRTIASAKPKVRKLLKASTKMVLVEDRQDVSVRMIWI